MRTQRAGQLVNGAVAVLGAILAAYVPADSAVAAVPAASYDDIATTSSRSNRAGPLVPREQISGDPTRGRVAYDQFACAGCHGPGATGRIGPPLAGTQRPFDSFRSQVRTPAGGMIAYPEEGLPDRELADIYAYLQSLAADGGSAGAAWRAGELINLPTPSHPGGGVLELHFSHRFSQSVRDAGAEGLYGLDSFATPGVTLTYGLGNRLAVFGGRTANLATWELGARFAILAERPGESAVSAAVVLSGSFLDADGTPNASRLVAQLPVGVHVSRRFSLLAVPIYASHTDEVGEAQGADHSLALGLGATLRLDRRWSIDGEWVRNLSGFERADAVDQWQVGVGIKVGGHVFQLLASNSIFTTPDFMAAGTQRTGIESDVRVGFNLVRLFKL